MIETQVVEYNRRFLVQECSIWWLWTAYDPPKVHVFEVAGSDDIAWLGEGGWAFVRDNMNLGLVSL